jgi:hypothetical protein
MPDRPVDESKYVLGGCCVSDDDPTLKCKNGNNTPGLDKEIRMLELQDISKMTDSEIDSYAKQIWLKLTNPKKGGIDGNSER